MNSPFCVAPFINFYYKGDGANTKILPCCEGRSNVNDNLENFEYWWKGDFFKEIRHVMLQNKSHDICTRCLQVEETGGYHARNFYKKILNSWEKDNNVKLEYDVENGNQFEMPISYDYRGSNLCNLKCRMCHPSSSSEIAKEISKNKETYNNLDYFANHHQLYDDNAFDDFAETLPTKYVTRFKLLGGEPLIQKDVYKILDNLLESNNQDATIVITTNGTTIPPKFIKYIDKFKNLNMRISLDGIGDTHEYIRSNANWKKIEENCRYFAELSQKYDNLIVGFSFVVQAYNIFQIPEIIKFCDQWKNEYPRWRETFFSPVEQNWLSSAVLDNSDVNDIINQIYNIKSSIIDNKLIDNVIEIIEMFDKNRDMKNPEDLNKFVKYTRLQDDIRNTNIISVNSKFERYFNE